MRDDRREGRFLDPGAKSADLVGIDWPASPLVGVLAEDLQRFAPVRDRPLHRHRHAAGDGHVRAYSHWLSTESRENT